MEKIQKILAPTDLTEDSQEGVRYALNLAMALGAELTAYYVVGYDENSRRCSPDGDKKTGQRPSRQSTNPLESYQFALARFLSDHFPALVPWVKIREKVELGVADKKIVEWARKEGSDLIVISFHGSRLGSDTDGESVGEKVIRNAPCPVLSIHLHVRVEPDQKTTASIEREVL